MQGARAFGGMQPLDVGLSSPELRPQICVPVFGSGFTHRDVPDAAKGAKWPCLWQGDQDQDVHGVGIGTELHGDGSSPQEKGSCSLLPSRERLQFLGSRERDPGMPRCLMKGRGWGCSPHVAEEPR